MKNPIKDKKVPQFYRLPSRVSRGAHWWIGFERVRVLYRPFDPRVNSPTWRNDFRGFRIARDKA